MKIKEITNYLEKIAPLSYQESYDNCGLIIGDEDTIVNAALITLDCTEAVVDEAIDAGCNLIISHHPIIFTGLKKINGKNYIERTIIKAIKNNIAVYAMHTNLDNLDSGVSAKIADKIGLINRTVLRPKDPNRSMNIGSGIFGELVKSIKSELFLKELKNIMFTDCIRHTLLVRPNIKKVAVCGGSGSFLISNAKALDADIFISADFKYHDFFDADHKLIIADIGHYESEQFTKELIYDLLTKNFTRFAVQLSKLNTNPIKYL